MDISFSNVEGDAVSRVTPAEHHGKCFRRLRSEILQTLAPVRPSTRDRRHIDEKFWASYNRRMETLISGQLFEWDDEKAELNWQKHHVAFEDAVLVFEDENRIEEYDDLHSDEEDRWQVIGMVNHVLFVIYTERGESLRIISAREANIRERRRYYGNGNLFPA